LVYPYGKITRDENYVRGREERPYQIARNKAAFMLPTKKRKDRPVHSCRPTNNGRGRGGFYRNSREGESVRSRNPVGLEKEQLKSSEETQDVRLNKKTEAANRRQRKKSTSEWEGKKWGQRIEKKKTGTSRYAENGTGGEERKVSM